MLLSQLGGCFWLCCLCGRFWMLAASVHLISLLFCFCFFEFPPKALSVLGRIPEKKIKNSSRFLGSNTFGVTFPRPRLVAARMDPSLRGEGSFGRWLYGRWRVECTGVVLHVRDVGQPLAMKNPRSRHFAATKSTRATSVQCTPP